jgi:hypothetical protein
MRRGMTFLLGAVLLIALAFSGCAFFETVFGGGLPDLTVVNVEPIKEGVKTVGVRVVFENLSKTDADGVEFSLMLSSDTTMSTATDWVFYKGTVSVPAGVQVKRDLNGETDIGPYLENNKLTPPADGQYYIGAVIDPADKMVEDNELNNEVASANLAWFIEGQSYQYAIKLRIGMPANLLYYDRDGNNIPVPGGTTRLLVSAIPAGSSPQVNTDSQYFASFPQDVDLSTIPNAFVRAVDVTYSDTSGAWSPYFYIGIDELGDYAFYFILDSNNDGDLWMYIPPGQGPMYLDPWQTIPPDALSTGNSYHVSGDEEITDTIGLQNGNYPVS